MIEPYYRDEKAGITIYHGNALDVLPYVKADIIVTDPPFGVKGAILNPHRKTNGRAHNTWHAEPDWDNEINPEWCKACCESAPVIAWFGNWKRRETVSQAMEFPIRCEIIWAKDTHVGPPCPLAMRDERIWIYSKAGLKVTRFETTVWDEPIIPTWAHRHHKNEKPLPIMRRLIELLAAEDATVLDPFMGSGTTLRAAKDLGRKAIAIELEERYCEIAVKRLAQEVLF